MKLHRLRVANFAAVREADIEFGQGLNVLYGPNDLGKSTLVDAIRLALLLPHGSTSCDQYVGWTGGRDPMVELTFETESQRIWRVRKEFGKSGSSLLQESKNGKDFDDVERARKVDGRLREILRWGISEPGGSGGSKGIPTSFLATALLSTQSDVAAMLRESLQNDPTASGKEQIAAALQAVAQDPLFVALLNSAQARRDEAYTDKGAKKTAKGSVFKVAAERVRETRDEKERLQRTVAESEGAENSLRDLIEKRGKQQEALATATDQVLLLERLALQAADRAAAAEQVRCAQEEVQRILTLSKDVEEAERKAKDLLVKEEGERTAVTVAQSKHLEADLALKAAEEVARAEGSDPGVTDTVVRQDLELRKAAADQAANVAQQRIDVTTDAQRLVDAAAAADREYREQETIVRSALEQSSQAGARETTANGQLLQCDLLERALDVHFADKEVADAQAAVEKKAGIQARLDVVLRERAASTAELSAIKVPQIAVLGKMRRLANELAAARGSLDVGFVVTVNPTRRVEVRIQKDRALVESTSADQPLEIEATAEVEIGVADIATVRVRGGRRDAQDRVRALEERWNREVVPHLAAAAVLDLESLDAKVAETQELDATIKAKDNELDSLQVQIGLLAEVPDVLQHALIHAKTCRAAIGDVPLDTLAADLGSLGADPLIGLRSRRLESSKNVDAARKSAAETVKLYTIAQERTANLRSTLDAAGSKRDIALASFLDGLDAALAAAQAEVAAAMAEKQNVAAELASLESTIASRKKRIEQAGSSARELAAIAKNAVASAQENLTTAVASHAAHGGRLTELRRQRDAEDLQGSETGLREVTERFAALPVPERDVPTDEVDAAKNRDAGARSELAAIERDIHRAHGALEQVGGAVARERLRDATEAFELAERYEREIEADYEAWKLLLDQMKEADSAQASNLGQVLAPAIASRFQTLTHRRYESLQLSAQLGTEGVVVGGAARPAARLSVGTREQLSTLYRLSLAEYLQVTVVLDDQLVQSDDSRMDWFRALLMEKARIFQIIVFTCRPGDYLTAASMVPDGSDHADTDDGLIRAIDLERALG
jgi:DNA repair exonuclease SbcCD ATPase subunit